MDKLLDNVVTDRQGREISVKSLMKPGEFIGLLFVNSISIPCQEQIPKVILHYNKRLQNSRNKLHIIIIDQESNIRKWKEYRYTLPWLAVPYDNSSRVARNFPNVPGFPTLQLYNGSNGKLLVPDIIDDILNDRDIPYLSTNQAYIL